MDQNVYFYEFHFFFSKLLSVQTLRNEMPRIFQLPIKISSFYKRLDSIGSDLTRHISPRHTSR
ncbi:hypothetical protein HanXRQr2_Chr16g0770371 [Helianthus annuus]|uniref:Uncharacterized protein n=1 Tax=Helianthus annuus TaxID=4232 RepID=A0A251UM06_HELAN|nr:hypothetical protein HanXRQr2_Chr16g0770371 [Helianthus annuus]KAJ0444826.1 hypothetical protein HanIR_Chr16g0836061 [Helianthus annuus]